MAYKNILVAFDKSDSARDAVQAALDLAGNDESAQIHIISIMPSMEETYAYGGVGDDMMGANSNVVFDSEILGNLQDIAAEREETAVREALADMLDGCKAKDTIEIAYGTSPATGIMAYAESNACDLIVMGCRGLGALRG